MAGGDWGYRWYLGNLQEVFALKQRRRMTEGFWNGSQHMFR